jgi:hypothetical protein
MSSWLLSIGTRCGNRFDLTVVFWRAPSCLAVALPLRAVVSAGVWREVRLTAALPAAARTPVTRTAAVT